MPTGTPEELRSMVSGDSNCKLLADDWTFYKTLNLSVWEKRDSLVGTGECVPLVQEATGAPSTDFWRKGPLVKNNSNVPNGTAIATFDDQDHYPGHTVKLKHAAIFVELSDKGLVVVDQWKTKTPKRPERRTLRYGNPNSAPVNDGNAFCVVLTPKIINQHLGKATKD